MELYIFKWHSSNDKFTKKRLRSSERSFTVITFSASSSSTGPSEKVSIFVSSLLSILVSILLSILSVGPLRKRAALPNINCQSATQLLLARKNVTMVLRKMESEVF